ncbi:hypothetical protein [Jiulongibacter sp. NS-SX5]|uniref:hypothetical protein n=1 Tax=Jiulongibacter sp. NS-SX5 TaxID=3463854 RepID=UPI004058F6C8
MKYLDLFFSTELQSDELIKNLENYLSPYEDKFLGEFCEKFPEYKIPKIQILFTRNIWQSINEFYLQHEIKYAKLKPKGLDHLFKIESYAGETKFFWSINYLSEEVIPVIFKGIIENIIGDYLRNNFNIDQKLEFNKGIKFATDFLFRSWLLEKITRSKSDLIITVDEELITSFDDFTFAFKKNIKDLHYQYQTDQNNNYFLSNSFLELELWVRRILQYRSSDNLSGFDEFEFEIFEILNCLEMSSEDISNISEDISLRNQTLILQVLKKCDIEVYDTPQRERVGTGFKITEGPKNLFPTLIDTHPRILAFLDILGFKALINEYETEKSSMVLKELKNTFDLAVSTTFKHLALALDQEIIKNLEHRMFSDCIVISIPYIEFEVDIKIGFLNMAIILNVFQQTFMKAGFYLRGHVTIGSYYSDDNMLFSGALVEAYQNESSTIFPIVSINQKIYDKLIKKSSYDILLPSSQKMIIKHNVGKTRNNIVLNPLFIQDMYEGLDSIVHKTLKTEAILNGINLGSSTKNLIRDHMRNSLMPDLQKEMEKEREAILGQLLKKHEEQISYLNNPNNDSETKTLASSIIKKYEFLIELFKWRINPMASENFQYVQLTDV